MASAEEDLNALQRMKHDEEGFSDRIFGYFVQQAVEKGLKAWLAYLGQSYPFTHDLSRLIDRLSPLDSAAGAFEDLAVFSPFAGRMRYGISDPTAQSADRLEITDRVALLLDEVRQRLA